MAKSVRQLKRYIDSNGPDVLTRVAMVGDDLSLDPGVGTCGKDGQGVPVGVGQPTIHVNNLCDRRDCSLNCIFLVL